MNGKAVGLVLLLSTVLGLFPTLAFKSIKAGIQRSKIYVDPKDNEFLTRTTPVGSNFTVSVKSADWTSPGVYSYQLTLLYNNTLIEAVATEFPKNHWLEPSTPIIYRFLIEGPPNPDIRQDQGLVDAAFTLLGEEFGRTGGGTLFTVAFKIMQIPPKGENLSCTLELENVIMVDPDAEAFPSDQYDIVKGNYLISAADPTIKEDLNQDGTVNILDMAVVALAFHSHPSDARWNPKADLNGDGEVNIIDVALIARAWTW